jgi:transcriptional regulator with XRE-family HTH domain
MSPEKPPPRGTVFNDVMREAREASGLSTSSVAQSLSLPESYVLELEAGEIGLAYDVFLGICNALQRDPFELLAKCVHRFNATYSGPAPDGYWSPERVERIEKGQGPTLLWDVVEIAKVMGADPLEFLRQALARHRAANR